MTRWDLIIMDEAHKMSAYAYPGRERMKIDKTKKYEVGQILSNQTDHLLFLTATPHRGDDENFPLFLDLLRPGLFARTDLLGESVANAMPNWPEHFLKHSGLCKLHVAGAEFNHKDLSDGTAREYRGNLNIPPERFIGYAEFDHALRGADMPDTCGPWFGWAGWDAAQRADALAFLLDHANRAGWPLGWQQCGLRAALRDLLPNARRRPR